MFMTFKMKFLNAPKPAQGHRNYIPKDITNPRAGAEQSGLGYEFNQDNKEYSSYRRYCEVIL